MIPHGSVLQMEFKKKIKLPSEQCSSDCRRAAMTRLYPLLNSAL